MPDIINQFIASVSAFLPGLLGAIVLLLVAWIIGSLFRAGVVRLGEATNLDRRLNSKGITRTIGDIVFWLVFLVFIPGILQALNLQGVLIPVQSLLNQFLGFLPNVFGAAVILVVGFFVAKVVRQIIAGVLSAAGVDRLSERVGVSRAMGNQQLSELLALLVYILILIPTITAALNALALNAVTQPITAMLDRVLLAVPNIFAAAIILFLAFVIGRLVAQLVTDLLTRLGFNQLVERMGFRQVLPGIKPAARTQDALLNDMLTNDRSSAQRATARKAAQAVSEQTPASIVGSIILVAIMAFAAAEAANMLGFGNLSVLINQFIVLGGQILTGLAIFGVGLWLSNMAASAISSSDASYANTLAMVARFAILALSGAMALRQMGLATEIINLAFGLLLGAVAVAAALAFGLGGREIAGRELDRAVKKMREEEAKSS